MKNVSNNMDIKSRLLVARDYMLGAEPVYKSRNKKFNASHFAAYWATRFRGTLLFQRAVLRLNATSGKNYKYSLLTNKWRAFNRDAPTITRLIVEEGVATNRPVRISQVETRAHDICSRKTIEKVFAEGVRLKLLARGKQNKGYTLTAAFIRELEHRTLGALLDNDIIELARYIVSLDDLYKQIENAETLPEGEDEDSFLNAADGLHRRSLRSILQTVKDMDDNDLDKKPFPSCRHDFEETLSNDEVTGVMEENDRGFISVD